MDMLGTLRPADFAHAIQQMGEVPLKWYRSQGECPACHDPVTGFAPNPDCPRCDGVGIIYSDAPLPVDSVTGGKVLLSQAVLGRTFMPVELVQGDIVCSFVPGAGEYDLEEGDRLVLASRELRWRERIVRGAGVADRLRRSPATRMQAVYTAAGPVVTGFSLSSDGRSLAWAGGPTAGTQYLAAYWYRPSFVVVAGSIHHRVEAPDGGRFPNRVLLRPWQQAPTDRREAEY